MLDRPCNRLRGDLRVVKGMAATPLRRAACQQAQIVLKSIAGALRRSGSPQGRLPQRLSRASQTPRHEQMIKFIYFIVYLCRRKGTEGETPAVAVAVAP